MKATLIWSMEEEEEEEEELPPLVAWRYDWRPEPGSGEAFLYDCLEPRDWLEAAD